MKFYIVFFIWIIPICATGQNNHLKKEFLDERKETLIIDSLTLINSRLFWYDKYGDEYSLGPFGPQYQKKSGRLKTLHLAGPLNYILAIGHQIPFLVFPGDTLIYYTSRHKLLYGGKGMPMFKHKTNPYRTNELIFFVTLYDSLGPCFGVNSYFTPKSISHPAEAFSYHLNVYYNRKRFLEGYFTKGLVSSGFFEYVNTFFQYKFYDDVFASFNSRKLHDTTIQNYIYRISDSLFVKLIDKNGPHYYSWYDALRNYIELRMAFGIMNPEKFDKTLELIAEQSSGPARDFAVFYLFKYLITENVDLVKTKLNLLRKYCDDEDYIEYITGYTAFTKKKAGDGIRENLMGYSGNSQKLSLLLESYKGKVVYMDFWASWCLPCLEEMPFSKQLMMEFKKRDVVFLFLSTDNNSDKWKKSIQANGMKDQGEHYLILDGNENYFVRKYHIRAIPRYIILNKHGDVVNSDAPRPGEEKTRELIMELLEKK